MPLLLRGAELNPMTLSIYPIRNGKAYPMLFNWSVETLEQLTLYINFALEVEQSSIMAVLRSSERVTVKLIHEYGIVLQSDTVNL